MRASIRGFLAPALFLAIAACTEWPTDRTPGGPQVEYSAEVTGEIRSGDQQEYWIQGEKDGKLQVLFQALSGSPADTLHLELLGATTSYMVATVTSTGSDATLGAQASPWLLFPGSVPYRIRVRGAGARHGGRFRFRIITGEQTVQMGDTVYGAIIPRPHRQADVDRYTFEGKAGQEVVLFFQALDGSRVDKIDARLEAPRGPLAHVASAAPQSQLEMVGTPRIRLPQDGTYRITVRGEPQQQRVSYRFQVAVVDRAPETVEARIRIGDVVTDEAIDAVGDVDEFHFTGSAGQRVNVLLQVETGLTGGLWLEVLDQQAVLAKALSATPGDTVVTGRFTLPRDGDYTIRLNGRSIGTPETDTGRYRFGLFEIDPRPESVPARVAIGDRVVGEAIDYPGDIDEFVFAGVPGTEMNVVLDAGREVSGGLTVQVFNPSGALIASGHRSTPRFVVSQPGDYKIVVFDEWWRESTFTGPYTLHLHRVNRAPEHISSRIRIGEWVRGEAIDEIGDVDEFTFHGTEGQEVNIFARLLPGASGPLWVFRGGDHFVILSLYDVCREPDSCWSGVFLLPHTGDHRIIIDSPVGAGQSSVGSGPYEFLVFPIDPAPESVPPTFAIGDTIRGESIFPAGDVDEFTFEGEEGDALRVSFQSTAEALVINIRNASTGELLAGQLANHPPEWGDFVLPSTGTYTVRVASFNRDRSSLQWGTPRTGETGPYTFSITRRD